MPDLDGLTGSMTARNICGGSHTGICFGDWCMLEGKGRIYVFLCHHFNLSKTQVEAKELLLFNPNGCSHVKDH